MSDDKKAASLNKFAIDLFQVLSHNSNKNEFFSPFSILTALNMTLLGARNNTEKQLFEGMRYIVGFENSKDVHIFMKKKLESWEPNKLPFTLYIANRVLIQKSDKFQVEKDFTEKLKLYYEATVDEVDFEHQSASAVEAINEWVSGVTKGKIPTILEKIDQGTICLLLNAIYFKGMWSATFNKKSTSVKSFYNFGDKQKAKNIPLMHKSDVKIPVATKNIDGEEVIMFELTYKGNISMFILMTKSISGLPKILPRLSYEFISNMELVPENVDDLWIPKFKIEMKYELVAPLKKLGIRDAFDRKADFSGIRESKDVAISDVIHKATIEVNEEGTVATAATAATVMFLCSSYELKFEIRVDHPFVYFIKDKSTSIVLFVGKVEEL